MVTPRPTGINNINRWSLDKLPPEGHEDCGAYFHYLFRLAKEDRDRRKQTDRWLENYKIFRGIHGEKRKDKINLNLIGANIQRTTANITARDPAPEAYKVNKSEPRPVVPTEVIAREIIERVKNPPLESEEQQETDNNGEAKLTSLLKTWWNKSNQQPLLHSSVQGMEIYGATFEKYIWDWKKRRPKVIYLNIFSAFPAPGTPEEITDLPYFFHVYPMRVSESREKWGVDLKPDDAWSLLGRDREEMMPGLSEKGSTTPGRRDFTNKPRQAEVNVSPADMTLVYELWIKDKSTITVEEIDPDTDPDNLEPVKRVCPKYPDGIRRVVFANDGDVILEDGRNPSINWELTDCNQKNTWLWGRIPFEYANSYRDDSSIWGFSQAEQVAPLNYKLNQIVSRMIRYLERALLPITYICEDTGVSPEDFNNLPGLVITPTSTEAVNGIGFIRMPDLPSDYYRIVELIMSMFDRISQIEDADRGVAPKGVVAAAAITALIERGAVLIRQKIRAVDELVTSRALAAISLYLNYGTEPITIKVNGEFVTFTPRDLIVDEYEVVIESGSTIHKSQLQVAQDALQLYQLGIVDDQAVLDATKFPEAKAILERMAEKGLDQVLAMIAQAGYPVDGGETPIGVLPPLIALKEYLELSQQVQPGQGQAQAGPRGALPVPGDGRQIARTATPYFEATPPPGLGGS